MFIRKEKTRKKTPKQSVTGSNLKISEAQRDRWCHWATVLQSHVITKLTDPN